ncbi:hypothetical protein [Nonomuraea sp. NPDC049784]|uniref:hypothetical protein n=1 Tax=Nonomuraea sp. NPDC049784 TaxID=3154361 RepID=UPI0033CD3AD4
MSAKVLFGGVARSTCARSGWQVDLSESARRKLKRRAKRERRFAANTNHVIANEIVADAQRTGRGIAVEELAGIRDRVRLWPSQRATLSTRCGSCGFAGPADHIAALNVSRRASAVWAFVNMPNEFVPAGSVRPEPVSQPGPRGASPGL